MCALATNINPMREKLRNGHPVFGVLITIPSVHVVQALARSGADFLTIDLEHGPIDITSAHAMIAATSGTGVSPIVRLPTAKGGPVKVVLDSGAMGVEFPLLKTAEEVAEAARSVRYPPRGERAWGPFYASLHWNLSLPEYVARANDEVLFQLLIEHPTTIDNLGQILDGGEVDVAFIAPGDLATSLGLNVGQAEHPEVQALVERAERVILERGIPMGGVAFTSERARRMLDVGYRVLAMGIDYRILQEGVRSFVAGIGPRT